MTDSNRPPATFEEAIASGFEPIDDIETFLRERVGTSIDSLRQKQKRFSMESLRVDCSVAPPGTPCFDFCYSNGVRILGYCGQSRLCDRFVHGACEPY